MTTEFNTSDNKFFLWNLLEQQGAFTNIQESSKPQIINLFEHHINNINNDSSDLMSKNKKLIDIMLMQLQTTKNNNGSMSEPSTKTIVKGSGKSDGVDINFMKQREDMNNTLNPSKPNNVDFSEDLDEKLQENEMNIRLESMMANRNLDININQNNKDAEEWINNGNNTRNNTIITETNNINLKIGEKTTINDIQEISATPAKSVSWADNIDNNQNNQQVNNLFSKLKQKKPVPEPQSNNMQTDPTIKDVVKMLLDIKKTQDDILEMLRSK